MNEYVYITIQSLTDQEDVEIYIKAKGYTKKELNTDETGYKPQSQALSLSAFMASTHEKIGALLDDPQKYEEFEKELEVIR